MKTLLVFAVVVVACCCIDIEGIAAAVVVVDTEGIAAVVVVVVDIDRIDLRRTEGVVVVGVLESALCNNLGMVPYNWDLLTAAVRLSCTVAVAYSPSLVIKHNKKNVAFERAHS